MNAPRVDPIERFWAKVNSQPDECWEWIAGRDRHGYGFFTPTGRGRLCVICHREHSRLAMQRQRDKRKRAA